MFCDEVLDAIEPIAAGELTPDGRVAAHLTTCPNCAAALTSARRVEQMLQERAVPRPAPQVRLRIDRGAKAGDVEWVVWGFGGTGRRARLRILCPKGRVGSTPSIPNLRSRLPTQRELRLASQAKVVHRSA